ncbi:NAD(P)/FAD-dependent oxidoreductase [Nonomuraea rhodomycinica]|uniref:NAD(P)/FAD-dependent oxidoreductase n=1 Tax=Nonomuraea rhodomycinica TaxID=1712872 RepID=UPI0028B10A7D|nr:NAD(P)/FAD-dependent oxidoreductase [Nonomuraea rhodomycinica]
MLFANLGARVALLEKHSGMDAYKVLCTHTLQPSCMPVVKTLGLLPPLERAGARRHVTHLWTRWGWIEPRPAPGREPLPHGLNVRRRTLDPLLRRLAAETPGVELRLGSGVNGLLEEDGRFTGVRVTANGTETRLTARLVVGADGRNSTVGSLSGLPVRLSANNRLGFLAQYRGLPDGDASRVWFLDPDTAFAFPNDDGVTVVACSPSKEHHASAFRADPEGSFERFVRALPDAPPIDQGERISKVIGTRDLPNVYRKPYGPGLALVGDAALATDPLWGVGCGWAFQSAQWLVDAVGPAVAGGGDVPAGLAAYGGKHRAALDSHHRLMEDYAAVRPFNVFERLLLSAAARDAGAARHYYAFASRLIDVKEFASPGSLLRAARVNAFHRLRNAPSNS